MNNMGTYKSQWVRALRNKLKFFTPLQLSMQNYHHIKKIIVEFCQVVVSQSS